jgi:penicillin-binding protein 1A
VISNVFRASWAWVCRHPLVIFGVLFLAALVTAGSFATAYVTHMVALSPGIEEIQRVKAERPTVVLTADGQEMAVFRRTNRERVKLAQISPSVIDALLATEDHRFYEHKGLDVRRTLSAALRTARGDLQGGSTITQQLARNMFPNEIGRAPTLERKVKEAITAWRIESAYSKDEILEMYLNTVPFLYNAHGIEIAARTYFDRSAGELDVLQAATLIGMLKGTSYYNPVLKPERAVQRRNIVLAQLVKHGKLPQDELEALKSRPLGLDFERQEEPIGNAPHLTQQLRRWLITWADRNGYNIYADGLVVRTTIDSRMQQTAIEALTRQADKLQLAADKAWGKGMSNKRLFHTMLRETQRYQAEIAAGRSDEDALKKLEGDAAFIKSFWQDKILLQAGFLAQDPATGHVKAWVGSRDFRQDQFDHVQQARRQPGSTFKPFVYGAAFAQGIGPDETLIDGPVEIQLDDRTIWKPGDVDASTYLPTSLRDGLVKSKNSITAQLMQRVGPQQVAQLAQAMGVRQSKLDVVPSLALGTSPVTLKEMVSAYSTIANYGTFVEPVLVTRIENAKGEVIEQFGGNAPESALPPPTAQLLLDVMRGVVDRGTGTALRRQFGLKGDVAGKTGTTQDNTDGWFILMHPQLVTGAWVGFNDARITMGDSWGQGGKNALLIVGDFMQQSTKAGMLDAKAKFDAPRVPPAPVQDPTLMGQPADVWAAVPTGSLGSQPGVVVSMPPQPQEPVQPEIAVVAPQARTPEFSWGAQRQRSAEYQDSPGFSPSPGERAPQAIIIHPSQQDASADDRRGREMGGPGRPSPDARYPQRYDPWYDRPAEPRYEPPPPPSRSDQGITILRSY